MEAPPLHGRPAAEHNSPVAAPESRSVPLTPRKASRPMLEAEGMPLRLQRMVDPATPGRPSFERHSLRRFRQPTARDRTHTWIVIERDVLDADGEVSQTIPSVTVSISEK
jgi:hypothetical protein